MSKVRSPQCDFGRARVARLACTGAAALALAGGVSACSRTPDGSYVLSRPLLPSMLRRPAPPPPPSFDVPVVEQLPAEPPPTLQAEPRPVQAKRSVPQVEMWKPSLIRPPFTPSETAHPLDCRNETSPTGRIRVVCE